MKEHLKERKTTTIRELLFICWHDDFFNILAWICLPTKKIHIKQITCFEYVNLDNSLSLSLSLYIYIYIYIYILYILNHFYVIIGIVNKGKNSINVCVNLAKDNN
jgi:hypothetical protein